MKPALWAAGIAIVGVAACDSEQSGAPRAVDLPYEIDVEPVVSLGSPDDSLLLDWNVTLAANDSVIVAGRLPSRGAFAVYDWDGRQIASSRSYGGGPGEFIYPQPRLGPGDSIWIVDSGNQRVSVLERGGRAVTRAFPLRGAIRDLIAVDSERVVIAGTLLPDGVPTEDMDAATWSYLHIVDRNGAVGRSFLPRRGRTVGVGVVAAAGERIWLAKMHRPAVEVWSLSGEHVRTIDREIEWFEPWDSVGEGALEGLRSRPRVADVGVDGEGRLWLKTYIPLADRESVRSTGDYNRVMDTLIEVVDSETGQLLAQRRFDPAYIRRVSGRDLWATARQNSAGYVFVDIWRAHLVDNRLLPSEGILSEDR